MPKSVRFFARGSRTNAFAIATLSCFLYKCPRLCKHSAGICIKTQYHRYCVYALVRDNGLEPLTLSTSRRRSTSWANRAKHWHYKRFASVLQVFCVSFLYSLPLTLCDLSQASGARCGVGFGRRFGMSLRAIFVSDRRYFFALLPKFYGKIPRSMVW